MEADKASAARGDRTTNAKLHWCSLEGCAHQDDAQSYPQQLITDGASGLRCQGGAPGCTRPPPGTSASG
ncbi:hypothetical protein HaLaN_07972 [Haematococcus lacustris]|uniref:Uncharacterized protein n=1 Tax=Haematococcus lacustris TaxID=44745 RepID=A0A699YSQ7_HAELA|nr:hypothetical protein HaLaN_07972 [Haematococcus lacustris]